MLHTLSSTRSATFLSHSFFLMSRKPVPLASPACEEETILASNLRQEIAIHHLNIIDNHTHQNTGGIKLIFFIIPSPEVIQIKSIRNHGRESASMTTA
jgi:hypothetical protein